MTRKIQVHQVDAFTREPFTGNPTGVVLNADALSEAQMLAIARELNNAETAVRGEYEGGLGVVELARDGEHLRLGERIGVEHRTGRVSGDGFAGERVNLRTLDLERQRS